jgi:uncharacterized protein
VRFWDSSAVVPLLVSQPSSSRVDAWFQADPSLVVWTLTPIEITSALWRLVREGALPEDAAWAAESMARELWAASRLVADVEGVKATAERLLRLHVLRAADALQLASALVWTEGRPQGSTFHTLDDQLAAAAKREGFEVP